MSQELGGTGGSPRGLSVLRPALILGGQGCGDSPGVLGSFGVLGILSSDLKVRHGLEAVRLWGFGVSAVGRRGPWPHIL